jgi:hypothetical protein
MTDTFKQTGNHADKPRSGLDWALSYLGLGWGPIPLRPRDKRPLVSWEEFQTRRPDESEIGQWFERWTKANIGVVTGEVSGIVVLDIDPNHDGENSLGNLERQYGKLAGTVESRTGGGGRHLYFQYPGFPVRNRTAVAPGLDVRADGGYIVVPPSIHPSGRPYAWARGHDPWHARVAPLPEWLLELIIGGRQPGRGYPLRHWRELLRQGVAEGERNNTIASLTGHLLWHEVDPEIILDLLLCWNAQRCRPPLADDEVARTVENIVHTHERRSKASRD